MKKGILFVILAKNKALNLPLYLDCLLNQTFNKNKIHLYIRSNDNNDNTQDVIEQWLEMYGNLYASVYKDYSSINEDLKQIDSHSWNIERFKILSEIKDKSIEYAKEKNLDYFIVDLDTYLKPKVLNTLYCSKFGIIAPFLIRKNNSFFSNFHCSIDENGYYSNQNFELYNNVFKQNMKGIIQVNVISHCIFIKNELLKYCSYSDETQDRPYVIFSRNLRKKNIPQYLDNRNIYGLIDLDNDFYGSNEGKYNYEDVINC